MVPWWCACGRTHRCTTLLYRQATRSGQLYPVIELIVAHRGHIDDGAPRSLDSLRCIGKHAISQGFTVGAGLGLVHTSRPVVLESRQKLPPVLSYRPLVPKTVEIMRTGP